METLNASKLTTVIKLHNTAPAINHHTINNYRQPGSIEKSFVRMMIKVRLIYFAFIIFKRPVKVWNAFKTLINLRKTVSGGALNKMYKIGGKYYVSQYRPGWPSKIYDNFLKNELQRLASPLIAPQNLSFIFLAITRKCPMRCEHCFEWDNLNQKESFTKDDLFKVIDLYQKDGVQQFHFSGGEPMVRFKDLLQLIKYACIKSECWVLTSGFNFTVENALLLKKAGCTGVVISIDHYIPELHNLFRATSNAFELAVNAVAAAHEAGLVTSITVCATKQFIDDGYLMPYMDFAKDLGVQFVQVLEPKSVGHYAGKDVLLDERHISKLEEVFLKINHDAEFKNYPIIFYHGYYQRRVGCLSGSRSLYIDSAGDVNACPFCHTKSFNVIQLVRSNEKKLPVKENKCPI